MKTKIEVELKPFQVPNYVLTVSTADKWEDGFREMPKYHLSELSANTLERLCEDFTREVFKKAGKSRPPQACLAG